MLYREICCAAAIACLKGTGRQKWVAFTCATNDSRKAAARALDIPLATLKTHLQRAFAANDVHTILELQAVGQERLLRRLARTTPRINAELKELASTLEPFSGTGG